MGTAIYHAILVAPTFAGFFLTKLLGRPNSPDELWSRDPELYRGLVAAKAVPDPAELDLTFTVASGALGAVREVELVPGGGEVPVTRGNLLRYLALVAHFKLNVETAAQCRAFLDGLRVVLPARWLRLFSQEELQLLIGGSQTRVDVRDWAQHARYAGGYDAGSAQVRWFWELVAAYSDEERAALLQFATACPRPPLLGFRHLHPPFCIQRVALPGGGGGDARLPTASTCMNLLKLPAYASKEVMAEKLKYTLAANTGFDLS